MAATAIGYAGEVAATVTASGPSGQQACGTPVTISALVEDVGGDPIDGQPVTWAFVSGNVSGDKILDTSSTTNSAGVATTRIQLSCASHAVTISATADDASGTVVVRTSGKGLPRTDTAPTETSTLGILFAAFAVLVGSGTILRKFASDRR